MQHTKDEGLNSTTHAVVNTTEYDEEYTYTLRPMKCSSIPSDVDTYYKWSYPQKLFSGSYPEGDVDGREDGDYYYKIEFTPNHIEEHNTRRLTVSTSISVITKSLTRTTISTNVLTATTKMLQVLGYDDPIVRPDDNGDDKIVGYYQTIYASFAQDDPRPLYLSSTAETTLWKFFGNVFYDVEGTDPTKKIPWTYKLAQDLDYRFRQTDDPNFLSPKCATLEFTWDNYLSAN